MSVMMNRHVEQNIGLRPLFFVFPVPYFPLFFVPYFSINMNRNRNVEQNIGIRPHFPFSDVSSINSEI